MRLALEEIDPRLPESDRPPDWAHWWERYVESKLDYKASSDKLAHKLNEAGADAARVLEWLKSQPLLIIGPQVKLLVQVYGEQFKLDILTAGLVEAAAQGVELIGPAPAGIKRGEVELSVEDFKVDVEHKQAVCPAGKPSDQCSRLAGEKAPQIQFRFKWNPTTCRDCPLRARCLGKEQNHKSLVVGEHHTVLQARRLEQKTEVFKARIAIATPLKEPRVNWCAPMDCGTHAIAA